MKEYVHGKTDVVHQAAKGSVHVPLAADVDVALVLGDTVAVRDASVLVVGRAVADELDDVEIILAEVYDAVA